MTLRPNRPASHAFTPTRDRLEWILRLHWIVATLLLVLIVGLWMIAPIPGGLWLAIGLWSGVAAYTETVRRMARSLDGDAAAVEAGCLRLLNALATADIVVLVAGVVVSGGPNSLTIQPVAIPMIVYGSFVLPRHAFAQAAFGMGLLGLGFVAIQLGWLPHPCPPDVPCTLPGAKAVFLIWLTTTIRSFTMTALTAHIGSMLRRGEEAGRQLAAEQDALANAQASGLGAMAESVLTELTTLRAATARLESGSGSSATDHEAQGAEQVMLSVRRMTAALDHVLEHAAQKRDHTTRLPAE